ncbi:MAG: SPOR domain-containing protein [Gemmatimonadetes bacterium]|nr:SPOR domain-containing protein [Gemmatimonadota bacterium]
MTYRFTMGRGAVGLLAAGSAGVGGLLFLAGMLVGVSAGAQAAPPAAPDTLRPVASQAECPVPADTTGLLPVDGDDDPAAAAVAWTPPPAAMSPGYADAPPAPSRYAADADPRPAPSRYAALPPAPASDPGPYSLQVGDFAAEDRAMAMLGRLERRGYEPFIVSGVDRRGQTFFHVRVDRYEERAEASEAALRFARREGLPAMVVPTEYALP